MAQSQYGMSLGDPWVEDRHPVKQLAKRERVRKRADELRKEHNSPANPPRRQFWDVDRAYMESEDRREKVRRDKKRLNAKTEQRSTLRNAHEALATKAVNKTRRTADPEYARQLEEAFLKPRMGGGKRTKQQR